MTIKQRIHEVLTANPDGIAFDDLYAQVGRELNISESSVHGHLAHLRQDGMAENRWFAREPEA